MNKKKELTRDIARAVAFAIWAGIIIPLLFWLNMGHVPDFGWGVTVFFVALGLLRGVGLFFANRPEYHTFVEERGNWADKIGAWWLMMCVFGPLAGWLLVNLPPLTLTNWAWLYTGRLVLAMGLPVVTALPLVRYVHGRGAVIMLTILVLVTALPILSGVTTLQDLLAGPQLTRSGAYMLPHTQQWLAD